MKKGTKLQPAPIDNKNLLEDAFEDDLFGDFYKCTDHRKRLIRHFVGQVTEVGVDDIYIDCIVDVRWYFGGNTITITLLGDSGSYGSTEETFNDLFKYYKKIFDEMLDDNEDLSITYKKDESSYKFDVSFYFV